jgi:hypothetical protein
MSVFVGLPVVLTISIAAILFAQADPSRTASRQEQDLVGKWTCTIQMVTQEWRPGYNNNPQIFHHAAVNVYDFRPDFSFSAVNPNEPDLGTVADGRWSGSAGDLRFSGINNGRPWSFSGSVAGGTLRGTLVQPRFYSFGSSDSETSSFLCQRLDSNKPTPSTSLKKNVSDSVERPSGTRVPSEPKIEDPFARNGKTVSAEPRISDPFTDTKTAQGGPRDSRGNPSATVSGGKATPTNPLVYRNQCALVTTFRGDDLGHGDDCRTPDAFHITIKNACLDPLDVHACIQKSDGTWDCGDWNSVSSNNPQQFWNCHSSGQYKVWMRNPPSFGIAWPQP